MHHSDTVMFAYKNSVITSVFPRTLPYFNFFNVFFPKTSILRHIVSQNEHFTTQFFPQISTLRQDFPQNSKIVVYRKNIFQT